MNCCSSTIHSLKLSTVTSNGSSLAASAGGTMRSTAESTKPTNSSAFVCSDSSRCLYTSPFRCVVPRTIFSQAMMLSGASLPASKRLAIPFAMVFAMISNTFGPTAVVTKSVLTMRSITSSLAEFTAVTWVTVSIWHSVPTTFTLYSCLWLSWSTNGASTSAKVTSTSASAKSLPMKPRPMLPAPK
ncbi:hypothetical protein VEx25_0252 [Vibrio antiquarius]|uniref:Uncharacterized protein n=1 Tax=Vibrio antiquarius (strain Ex25) TaxID=150340 RepID=A0ABM9WT97_VIBAE|nr:hypothetical protein VEx25_0252 [Vibrio antiquarius]